MRRRAAGCTPLQQRSMSSRLARASPQITGAVAPCPTSAAIACTASQSPGDAAGKPASMTSTPEAHQLRARPPASPPASSSIRAPAPRRGAWCRRFVRRRTPSMAFPPRNAPDRRPAARSRAVTYEPGGGCRAARSDLLRVDECHHVDAARRPRARSGARRHADAHRSKLGRPLRFSAIHRSANAPLWMSSSRLLHGGAGIVRRSGVGRPRSRRTRPCPTPSSACS